MVNLTESFTKLYGRRPTESEIATMMEMKREQEGWKRHKPEKKDMDSTKTLVQKRIREPRQPRRVSSNEPKYRWPKRATQLALRINRALLRQVTIENIAFIEDVSQSRIMQEIRQWDLPRVKVEEE
jgi:hypothetical protein